MHDEERVNLQGLSALAILDKETWALSKIFKNADYRIWAKQMISPENVFTTEFHIRVAREAINKNKKVVQWFRYINEYRSRWGDQAFADYQIYQTLKTTKASETKLALLFQSLDDIDDVKNLAAIMKNYQYQKWKEGADMIANKIWASTKKDPELLFKLFGLHKAGDQIDEKKRVIQWFRYATYYRAENGINNLPDEQIYTILKKSEASEAKLAALFQSLKDIDDVKTLATTMQRYQFKRWIDQDSIPESIRNAAQNILFRNQVSLGTDNAQTYKIAKEYAMFAFGPGAVLR
ncbi:Avirulence (Avh) protein [Phytophthora megakarya]|uniref:Avirulence (Avh) protein n=1 Tax=Phytophthora megakarya TaxID=4795 RepID=A0A225UTJ2_9STRA|nr:Avirulence (Avh) protein [Phytophthora megakarya]